MSNASTRPYILKTNLKRSGKRHAAGSVIELTPEEASSLPLETLRPATDKEAREVVERENAGRIEHARQRLVRAKADHENAIAEQKRAEAAAARDVELAEMRLKEAERLYSEVGGQKADAVAATEGKAAPPPVEPPKRGGGK